MISRRFLTLAFILLAGTDGDADHEAYNLPHDPGQLPSLTNKPTWSAMFREQPMTVEHFFPVTGGTR